MNLRRKKLYGSGPIMSQVQEIKNATDIVQLISERRPLQRSGANWRGLCPFHSEKSPSFFVNEQLQRYRCFGCGEAGDAFTFLEKYEGMTFTEALQYLAERAGITLTKATFSPQDDQRQRLLEILNLTKEYYHYLLTEHQQGEKARAYLKDRGVSAESIKIFQLGIALPSWDGLITYLHGKKKYALPDLEAAGLIIQRQTGRPYDRFRDRIMFPLTDHRGRVVGFSGRVLDKEAKEAKYINSPETQLYHKSEMLFGYSQLYQFIRKENEAVIVEGEFDVISSAQAHVNNVVAVKGSALTEDHMRLLSRTVSKVILSFDMDKAGLAATQRAIEVAKPFGLELRVIDFSALGEQKDPDELARTQPQVWRQAVKSSISVYDFFLNAAIKKYDLQTPEGKRKAIDELAPLLGQIEHAVELEFYIKKLSQVLDVSEQVVRQDLEKFKTAKKRGIGQSTVRKKTTETETEKEVPTSRKTKLEEYMLFLLLNGPEEQAVERAEKLKHITFARTGVKQIVTQLAQLTGMHKTNEFSKNLAEDLQQVLLELLLNPTYLKLLPDLDIEKEWNKSVGELIDLDITEEVQRIQEELDSLQQRAELSEKDEMKQAELLRRVVQLRTRKKKG
jgi:DNA primase